MEFTSFETKKYSENCYYFPDIIQTFIVMYVPCEVQNMVDNKKFYNTAITVSELLRLMILVSIFVLLIMGKVRVKNYMCIGLTKVIDLMN